MQKARQKKREDLVTVLGQEVLSRGLADASLKRLAAAAGTSDRMLLYYFDDKADLMAETLDHLAGRFSDALATRRLDDPVAREALRDHLVGTVLDSDFQPYLRLWLDVAALSARAVPPYQQVGGRLAEVFRDWIAGQLALSDATKRTKVTMQLFATLQGVAALHAVGLGGDARLAVTGRA